MCAWIQSVDSGAADKVSTARRPPRQGRAKGRGAVSRAFTLIELLVVIAIIVVLIGILLPALGAARDQARVAQTQALMSHLAADCEGYYQRFHAYPGPVATVPPSGTSYTTSPGSKLSGTQNMLLGLSYAMVPSGGMGLPGGGSVQNPPQPLGPIDYASVKPDGSYEQLAPYFSPTPKQIAIIQGTQGNGFTQFPAVVDSFPDGLPILYFRRTVGVDTPIVSSSPANASSPAAYYLYENYDYTMASALTSTSGTQFNEANNGNGFSATDLQNCVSVNNAAHGGFVLISAGIDRHYGTYNTKNDDLVQVGGD